MRVWNWTILSCGMKHNISSASIETIQHEEQWYYNTIACIWNRMLDKLLHKILCENGCRCHTKNNYQKFSQLAELSIANIKEFSQVRTRM